MENIYRKVVENTIIGEFKHYGLFSLRLPVIDWTLADGDFLFVTANGYLMVDGCSFENEKDGAIKLNIKEGDNEVETKLIIPIVEDRTELDDKNFYNREGHIVVFDRELWELRVYEYKKDYPGQWEHKVMTYREVEYKPLFDYCLKCLGEYEWSLE